jgi:hypothetical protein
VDPEAGLDIVAEKKTVGTQTHSAAYNLVTILTEPSVRMWNRFIWLRIGPITYLVNTIMNF